jgi:hypothetical protein
MSGTGAYMTKDYTSTPSIPSSSPFATNDAMDVSPMLGRAPFCLNVEMQSPSLSRESSYDTTETSTEQEYGLEMNSDPDDDDQMTLDSPALISRQSSFEIAKPHVPEYVHCPYLLLP